MAEFKYNVYDVIAEIGDVTPSGWGKSLTMTSFGEGLPKLDIRSWNENYSRMGKGISLSDDEAVALFKALGSHLLGAELISLDDVTALIDIENPMSEEEMLAEMAEQLEGGSHYE